MRKLEFVFIIVSSMLIFQACNEHVPNAGFKDMERQTIYDYIVANDSIYSDFEKILIAGGLDKTMSAYNPNGNDYTLFLPTNNAIADFIKNSQFSSLNDLLKDKKYVSAMARYHVVNMGIITNDFPFGALPELNLSGQYLTIGGFGSETDSSTYKVNNYAPISIKNIEVSNGYIHVITKALTPLTSTTYQWLEKNPQFSIFYNAVKATSFDQILSRIIQKDSASLNPVTLLVEPDSVFKRFKISSFDELVKRISPDNSDYKNPYNKLYNFVGCHILEGSLFLSDFEEKTTNYSTFGDAPVNINGEGIDLAINRGKEVFDTIISSEKDTTLIDFITFYYDQSNVLTQSGAIHFINQLMTPKSASVAEQYFQFREEPLFDQYREKKGKFLIDDKSLLKSISWTGGEDHLLFVQSEDASEQAWDKDYIKMEGDFSISYTLPKIAQGSYTLSIRANANDALNALVEVFFDGVKIGGLIDLTSGGSASYPYVDVELGNITLLNYESHVITVKTLIPGFFIWDYVHFKPL